MASEANDHVSYCREKEIIYIIYIYIITIRLMAPTF